MITQETALNVLNDFLSHRLGREVSTEETRAALRALEYAYSRDDKAKDMGQRREGVFHFCNRSQN